VTLDSVRSEVAQAETQIDRLAVRIADARRASSLGGA